mmetsp:Transcript_15057/g.16728  ORF Transcript_15057/g.16728 Transcript_15057/m.16728 type:complete len:88 (-) Transcript_15057:2062-2325(-)
MCIFKVFCFVISFLTSQSFSSLCLGYGVGNSFDWLSKVTLLNVGVYVEFVLFFFFSQKRGSYVKQSLNVQNTPSRYVSSYVQFEIGL